MVALHVLVGVACESPVFTSPPMRMLRQLLGGLYDLVPCTFNGSIHNSSGTGDSLLTSPDQRWESSTRLLILYTAGMDPQRYPQHAVLWNRIREYSRSGGNLLTIGPPVVVEGENSDISLAPAQPQVETCLVNGAGGQQSWRSICHHQPPPLPPPYAATSRIDKVNRENQFRGNSINLRNAYYRIPSMPSMLRINDERVVTLAVSATGGQVLIWKPLAGENWIHSCTYFDIDETHAACLIGRSDTALIDSDAGTRLLFLKQLLSEQFGLQVVNHCVSEPANCNQPQQERPYWLCFPSTAAKLAFMRQQSFQHPPAWLRLLSCDDDSPADNPQPAAFDWRKYFQSAASQAIGSSILYKDITESTQTFLEQQHQVSPKYDIRWPTGMVHVAGVQTSGRGRGRNSWLSQRGCLQFSFNLSYGPADRQMVFIQYLMALAVVKATRYLAPQPSQFPLFIKWPNDLYCHDKGQLVKIGGILVNSTSYSTSSINSGTINSGSINSGSGQQFILTVGCGLNVDNEQPTSCLNAVRAAHHLAAVSQETVLSATLNEFNQLYREFNAVSHSFQPFLNDYYRYWLHSGQRVLIDKSVSLATDDYKTNDDGQGDSKPPAADLATIIGINDEGYLLAQSIKTPSVCYELIPGRNSFNLSDGMIYRKL